MNKNTFFVSFLLTLFLGLFSSVYFLPTSNNTVLAHGGRNAECEDGYNVNKTNDNLASYTAPSTYTITGVCIKAGTFPFGDGHSEILGNGTYNDTTGAACYTVSGVGTQTVTVIRLHDTNKCQGISHIDVYKVLTPSSTPTPTLTNTPTPTTTPTPTDTPTPTMTPTPTDTPTPTPTSVCHTQNSCNTGTTVTPTPTIVTTGTPTPTQAASPSATPTPTSGQTNSASTQSSSSSTTPQVQPAQAVLGATTMAPTGSFLPTLMNSLLSMGVLSLSIGSALYAKAKKS